MPSYEENLKYAQKLLAEIQRRRIATTMNQQGFPKEIVWGKIDSFRALVSERTTSERDLLLPGLTSAIATTNLGVGACQELCQLASHISLKYGNCNITLVGLGNQSELRSGNFAALNHMIIMLGDVMYPQNILYSEDSKDFDGEHPTLDKFLSSQPKSVVVLDPLLNFAGSPADCLELKNYCTPRQIRDVLFVTPYKNTLGENDSDGLRMIASVVEENARRIADEIKTELDQAIMQAAKKNQSASDIIKLILFSPTSEIDGHTDDDGMTLTHFAGLYGNEDLVGYYTQRMPSLMQVPNKDGRTPLDHLSAGAGKIRETLVSAGLSPSDEEIRKISDNVKQLKAKLLKQGHHSDWLLRKEAYDGNLNNVMQLVKTKPERINEPGLPSKATALHQAARQGHTEICTFLMNRRGILIDAEDKDGNTPLLLAIKNKHFHLVALFIKARADVNKTNTTGESARSLLVNLGQDSLLSVGSEALAGIVSLGKGFTHFSPAPPQQLPPTTGDNAPISSVP